MIHSYSWTAYNDKIAVKTTDLSTFNNYSSGIPIEIRFFFEIENFVAGDSKKIKLMINEIPYSAKIDRVRSPAQQTRITWCSNFSKLINKKYPNVTKTKKYPDMRFEKISDDIFEISFIDLSLNDVASDIDNDYESEVIVNKGKKEGEKKQYYVAKYERNATNRKEAIRIHGIKCAACGFDFEKKYGSIGHNFIEVHHIIPLYSKDEETTVNPATDLICLCSNCHRMIHRNGNSIITVDELKEMICNQKDVSQ